MGRWYVERKNKLERKRRENVKFIYDDIEGKLKILDYNNSNYYLTVRYLDRVTKMFAGNLIKCKLGTLLLKIARDFRFEINEPIKDNKRDLIITDRDYRYGKNGKKRRYYKYKCNKCGFDCGKHYSIKDGIFKEELWVDETHVFGKRKIGCACCCTYPNIVVPEINSIYAKAPWMIDLGVSEEDAKKYTPQSNQKIKAICPNCGDKRNTFPNYLYSSRTINCTCGDGYSYPEKFMSYVLNSLNIEYEVQYSPKWIKGKRYDFYIPSLNMIIETHGLQHYEDVKGYHTSFETEQENDKLKEQIALSNGIKYYVVLDCRKSELEWIKKSILGSNLVEFFDFSEIDWLKCEEYSIKSNIIKEVCDYWNNKEEWETTTTIANNNKWKVKTSSTITKWLKKGTKLGWCNYDPKEESKKSAIRNGENLSKTRSKRVAIFKNDEFLGEFKSTLELERQSEELFGVKLFGASISSVCNGKTPQYKGFTFKYI